ATGRYEGFWELGLSAWDIAAGCLILGEAGGQITDFEGAQDFLTSGNIVCGNPTAHPIMLEIIKKYSFKLQNPNS
ncbi:MAG: inositol monophosphatase family protein, partial [Desulfobacterales bacterium]